MTAPTFGSVSRVKPLTAEPRRRRRSGKRQRQLEMFEQPRRSKGRPRRCRSGWPAKARDHTREWVLAEYSETAWGAVEDAMRRRRQT